MNTATVEIGDSALSSETLIGIIEDMGFDASPLDNDAGEEAATNQIIECVNGEQSEGYINRVSIKGVGSGGGEFRKLMLEIDSCDFRYLAATATSALANLQKHPGVINCTYSNILRDTDSAHFKMLIDESIVGPRTLVHMLERTLDLHTTVASLGGFMMAARMLKLQQSEQRKQGYRLLIASVFTIPILIITMVLPEYPPALTLLDTHIIKGLNVYGVLLLILSSPVLWIVGWPFHVKGLRSIMSGTLGMDFLVSSGTIAAYAFSLFGLAEGIRNGVARDEDVEFFETAAILIAVVVFGKYLECYAKGKTAAAIHRLTSLRATHARLVRSDPSSACETDGEASDFETEEIESMDIYGGLNSGDKMIDANLLQRGDVIRLVEGESVPSDGVLLNCSVGVDESMLTGESRLISKQIGDQMYGGSMVVEGSAEMTVTACGDSSALGRIVSSVQAAQGSKPPIQEVADRIACYFVPTVALISVLTFIVWVTAGAMGAVPQSWYTEKNPNGNYVLFAFVFSLAVWVSACPCAFGLATPTAILVATGVAAKHGVLVRRGAALQHASEVDTVVFDKTGTLTLGKTTVSDFMIQSDMRDDDKKKSSNARPLRSLLKLLLAAESSSSHPLAKGISDYCTNALKEMSDQMTAAASESAAVCDYNELKNNTYQTSVVPGKGIKLTVSSMMSKTSDSDKGHTDIEASEMVVLVGSEDLLTSHGASLTCEQLDKAAGLRVGGKVALYMSVNGLLEVIIGVSDMVRPDAAAVVAALHRWGMSCYMVTGDQKATALAIGHAVGISNSMIFAGAKPEEKEKFIQKLQQAGKKVAFIGDGTNDSPALARADVGFAMAGGTDIAIEAGDIVLCRNDLASMITAIHLAAKTMQRIKINYFWALSYNCILIPISAGVLYPSFHFALMPMFAGGAMALSSVCIVTSSLLLLLYSPPRLLGYEVSNVRRTEGNSVVSDSDLCNCPASLAPILTVDDGFLTATRRRVMSAIRAKFRPYYSLLSLVSPLDVEDDGSSLNPPGTTGIQDEFDVERASDEGLTDVEKFLRSSVPVDSYLKNGDSSDSDKSDVKNSGARCVFSIDSKNSTRSFRKRNTTNLKSAEGAGEGGGGGCSCNKSNCRCGPQCRCGARE